MASCGCLSALNREERYAGLKAHFFKSSMLKKEPYQQRLFSSKAVLCTLATLSSPTVSGNGIFAKRPIRHLIIDEASQIDMTSEFMVCLFSFV